MFFLEGTIIFSISARISEKKKRGSYFVEGTGIVDVK